MLVSAELRLFVEVREWFTYTLPIITTVELYLTVTQSASVVVS